MVGFRKEINREQNLEVQFEAKGGGAVDLIYDAWTSNGPVIMGRWAMPTASVGQGSHIPEPGDIVRVRWEQVNSTQLNVRVRYYDASMGIWHNDVINTTNNITSIANNPAPINFTDGYHQASSITIDSPYYSIRRYKIGILETYPATSTTPTATFTPTPTETPTVTNTPTPTHTPDEYQSPLQLYLPIVLKR